MLEPDERGAERFALAAGVAGAEDGEGFVCVVICEHRLGPFGVCRLR